MTFFWNIKLNTLVINFMSLDLAFKCAMPSGNCIFCNNHIFVKFALVKNITYMSGNNRLVPLKQRGHLVLGKPDSLISKEDIDLYNAVLRFVYYNFVIHSQQKTSATVSCLYKVTLRDITSATELNIFCESVTNHLMQS